MSRRVFTLLAVCGLAAWIGLRSRATSAAPAAPRGADSLARARQDSINRAQPGYIVDSIFTPEEERRRFRARFPTPVTRFGGGAPSRDSLVALFASGLARNDTAALRRLALTEAEFGDLVYPTSPYAREPYRQARDVLWAQIGPRSDVGLGRLLQRPPEGQLVAYACARPAERQGRNTLWPGCRVRVRSGDGTESWHVLFGSIIARDGRYKIVSYANER